MMMVGKSPSGHTPCTLLGCAMGALNLPEEGKPASGKPQIEAHGLRSICDIRYQISDFKISEIKYQISDISYHRYRERTPTREPVIRLHIHL